MRYKRRVGQVGHVFSTPVASVDINTKYYVYTGNINFPLIVNINLPCLPLKSPGIVFTHKPFYTQPK